MKSPGSMFRGIFVVFFCCNQLVKSKSEKKERSHVPYGATSGVFVTGVGDSGHSDKISWESKGARYRGQMPPLYQKIEP